MIIYHSKCENNLLQLPITSEHPNYAKSPQAISLGLILLSPTTWATKILRPGRRA